MPTLAAARRHTMKQLGVQGAGAGGVSVARLEVQAAGEYSEPGAAAFGDKLRFGMQTFLHC